MVGVQRLPVEDERARRVAKRGALQPCRVRHQRHPLGDGAALHVAVGVAKERKQTPCKRAHDRTVRIEAAAAGTAASTACASTAGLSWGSGV